MLPESEFARLKAVPGARAARVEAGGTLFGEGAAAPELYVLVSGALILERASGGRTDVRGAGSIVGEIGALSGGPHPYGTRATATAVLLAVPAAAVEGATERSAAFARLLARTLAERAQMLIASAGSAVVPPLSGGLFGPSIPMPGPESAAPGSDDEDSLLSDDLVPPWEAERRAAEAAARERATMDRTAPRAEAFYQKSFECPVCRNRFATHALREQFIEIEGRDSDLMERHRAINRLYYEVVVCPKCSFAAFAEDFARLVTGEDEAIAKAIAPLQARVASLDFLGFRDARLAQSAFELAIVAYGQRRSSHRKVASLYHRLGWLARQAGNAEREKRYLDTARRGYMAALEKLSADDQRLELSMTYLVAELSRRVDDLPVATKWVSQLLQDPRLAAPGSRMIADLARDLRQNLRPSASTAGR